MDNIVYFMDFVQARSINFWPKLWAEGYSRVANKREGENNRGGGLEMVRYNNNRGVGIIGEVLGEIENSPFLR